MHETAFLFYSSNTQCIYDRIFELTRKKSNSSDAEKDSSVIIFFFALKPNFRYLNLSFVS